LFKLTTCRAAQLRACPTSIMRGYARNAGRLRVLPEHLPDDLFAQAITRHPIGSIHRPENTPVRDTGRRCPSVDCHFHPGGHRHGADAAMLAYHVNDAPLTQRDRAASRTLAQVSYDPSSVRSFRTPVQSTGSVNQNVEPWHGRLEKPISPPIISTKRLEIANPKPVPPYSRVMEPSACTNG
jgi:hypothetical protein